MPATVTGDDEAAGHVFTDYDGDLHLNGGLLIGAETEGASIKGIYTVTMNVTVPNITDPDIAKVDVDTSAMTFACAVGDIVLVAPLEALPTNARLLGAWATAADTVQITYGSEGGNVTGAAKSHKLVFIDLT